MKFHHVCINVSDMDEALKLYRDILGFAVIADKIIPDGKGAGAHFDQQTLDDIFHVRNSKSRMVLLVSDERSMIELEQPIIPKVQKVPRKNIQYGYVGIAELALRVENIDEWFEKIKAAGYETQTSYVWEALNGRSKSFLFFDADDNMIQLCEDFRREKPV